MNAVLWITIYAVLSITALSFFLIQSFWIPMLIGAITLVVLVRLLR
jgi:hypothetical protein